MEVSLPAELEAFIQEKVRSGSHVDASDVVREALRTYKRSEGFESPELEAAILEGFESPHTPYGPETLNEIRRIASTLE